jgi:hypothetical protein
MRAADLAAVDGSLALNVGGFDNSAAQQLFARPIYAHDEIRWNSSISISKAGRLTIDYSLFHDVTPEGLIRNKPAAE